MAKLAPIIESPEDPIVTAMTCELLHAGRYALAYTKGGYLHFSCRQKSDRGESVFKLSHRWFDEHPISGMTADNDCYTSTLITSDGFLVKLPLEILSDAQNFAIFKENVVKQQENESKLPQPKFTLTDKLWSLFGQTNTREMDSDKDQTGSKFLFVDLSQMLQKIKEDKIMSFGDRFKGKFEPKGFGSIHVVRVFEGDYILLITSGRFIICVDETCQKLHESDIKDLSIHQTKSGKVLFSESAEGEFFALQLENKDKDDTSIFFSSTTKGFDFRRLPYLKGMVISFSLIDGGLYLIQHNYDKKCFQILDLERLAAPTLVKEIPLQWPTKVTSFLYWNHFFLIWSENPDGSHRVSIVSGKLLKSKQEEKPPKLFEQFGLIKENLHAKTDSVVAEFSFTGNLIGLLDSYRHGIELKGDVVGEAYNTKTFIIVTEGQVNLLDTSVGILRKGLIDKLVASQNDPMFYSKLHNLEVIFEPFRSFEGSIEDLKSRCRNEQLRTLLFDVEIYQILLKESPGWEQSLIELTKRFLKFGHQSNEVFFKATHILQRLFLLNNSSLGLELTINFVTLCLCYLLRIDINQQDIFRFLEPLVVNIKIKQKKLTGDSAFRFLALFLIELRKWRIRTLLTSQSLYIKDPEDLQQYLKAPVNELELLKFINSVSLPDIAMEAEFWPEIKTLIKPLMLAANDLEKGLFYFILADDFGDDEFILIVSTLKGEHLREYVEKAFEYLLFLFCDHQIPGRLRSLAIFLEISTAPNSQSLRHLLQLWTGASSPKAMNSQMVRDNILESNLTILLDQVLRLLRENPDTISERLGAKLVCLLILFEYDPSTIESEKEAVGRSLDELKAMNRRRNQCIASQLVITKFCQSVILHPHIICKLRKYF